MLKLLCEFVILLDFDQVLYKVRVHIVLSGIYVQRVGAFNSRRHDPSVEEWLLNFVGVRIISPYFVKPLVVINFVVHIILSPSSSPWIGLNCLIISLNLAYSKLM